eukprot:608191-Amphidinium_carterae.1
MFAGGFVRGIGARYSCRLPTTWPGLSLRGANRPTLLEAVKSQELYAFFRSPREIGRPCGFSEAASRKGGVQATSHYITAQYFVPNSSIFCSELSPSKTTVSNKNVKNMTVFIDKLRGGDRVLFPILEKAATRQRVDEPPFPSIAC